MSRKRGMLCERVCHCYEWMCHALPWNTAALKLLSHSYEDAVG